MNIKKTELDNVLIIETKIFGDHRGWFTENYNKSDFSEHGIEAEFIQDNHSMTKKKGTIRGLHFQKSPKTQSKLIRCTRGKVMDVIVDLRKGSPTYKKHIKIELSEENMKQILIPKGFAHGFLTLTDDVEVQYKVDEYYDPKWDRGIRFDDPDIGIDWGIENPILSEKDAVAPLLKDSDFNFSLKYLVTGANGQLGNEIVNKLNENKINNIAPKREEFDITKEDQVKQFILDKKPDVIIHCAAYTLVDAAEDNQEACYKVNVEGTKYLIEAAKKIDATFVYISTDYVFDGSGENPFTESDNTSPINYYGYTKELGEKTVRNEIYKHFIIRTSWVYGENGNNFVKTMLNLATSNDEIKVVDDQIGSPTYSSDLAEFIIKLIQTNNFGTYHGINEGYVSWYEFAKKIFELAKSPVKVTPITSEEYKTKAKRPRNSRLSNINNKVYTFSTWQDALERFLLKD